MVETKQKDVSIDIQEGFSLIIHPEGYKTLDRLKSEKKGKAPSFGWYKGMNVILLVNNPDAEKGRSEKKEIPSAV